MSKLKKKSQFVLVLTFLYNHIQVYYFIRIIATYVPYLFSIKLILIVFYYVIDTLLEQEIYCHNGF